MNRAAQWLGLEWAQSWAEALAALGTVAAFLIGALAFLWQQRDRRDDEVRQARLVHRVVHPSFRHIEMQGRFEAQPTVRMELVNRSDKPIFQVRMGHVWHNDKWTRPLYGFQAVAQEVVPQGSTLELYEEVRVKSSSLAEHGPAAWDFEFDFVDAAGRRWRRRGMDQPRRVRTPGPSLRRPRWRRAPQPPRQS